MTPWACFYAGSPTTPSEVPYRIDSNRYSAMTAPDDPSVVSRWTRPTVSNGKKHADDIQLSYTKYEGNEFAIRLTPRAVLPQATLGNGNQSDQFGSNLTGDDVCCMR